MMLHIRVGQVSRPAAGVHARLCRTWGSGADVDVCPTESATYNAPEKPCGITLLVCRVGTCADA